eukprot:631541-Hanusia_phi.AAC.1
MESARSLRPIRSDRGDRTDRRPSRPDGPIGRYGPGLASLSHGHGSLGELEARPLGPALSDRIDPSTIL